MKLAYFFIGCIYYIYKGTGYVSEELFKRMAEIKQKCADQRTG